MDEVTRDRFRGALLGLAVGDALGAQVEFMPRGSFAAVAEMGGGGPHHLPAGAFTDDASMAMCLAESLVECGFDPADQMRRYVRWWREGYWSSTGRCFDIGNTVLHALGRFLQTGDPMAGSEDPRTAGNGSIMRLAPIALFAAPDVRQAAELGGVSSRTTHGAPEAVDACRLLAGLLTAALNGATRDELLAPDLPQRLCLGPLAPRIAAVAEGSYRRKEPAAIRGSGYVVESLEAALWAFSRARDFRECVLLAVNLGDDADTTGAVAGQLAGAHYGAGAIPEEWLRPLARREEIGRLADALHQRPRDLR